MTSACIGPSRQVWLDAGLVEMTGGTLGLVPLRVMCPSKSCAQTKVCELDVTVGSNEDVVRFDVAMNESHPMDRLYGTDELCDVEERQMLRECSQFYQQTHHVST